MKNTEHLFNLVFGFGLLIYALMFKYGYFRGKQNNRFNKILNMDELIFPTVTEEISQQADKICFKVAALMALLTALNGVLSYEYGVENYSFVFFVVAFPGLMFFRTVFLYIKTKKRT